MSETQNPQQVLADLLTALSGHYKAADGSTPANIQEFMALPKFQEVYAQVQQGGIADQTGAIMATLKRMAIFSEKVTELPAWVLVAEDTDFEFKKGQRPAPRVDENGEPIVGVRIVLPDGRDRFLEGVDGSTFTTLQPVKLKGDITIRHNLTQAKKTFQIPKTAQLVAEAHDATFPEMTLDYDINTMGKGAFYSNSRSNTLSGEFGRPVPSTWTLRGTGEVKQDFNDENLWKVRATDINGNEVQIKLSTQQLNDIGCFVNEGDQPDMVSEAVRGHRFVARGFGSIFWPTDAEALGGTFDEVVAALEDAGRIFRNDKGGVSLNLKPEDEFRFDLNGTKIAELTGYTKNDGTQFQKISVLAADKGGVPWISPSTAGGFVAAIPSADASGAAAPSVDKNDPLYQALSGVSLPGAPSAPAATGTTATVGFNATTE